MDKTKRGIALFITLLVIASILSIVAISFSYLEKVQIDANRVSALIQGNLLYKNTTEILKQFFPKGKVNSKKLKIIYGVPLMLSEPKSGFNINLKCNPLLVGVPIKWLDSKFTEKVPRRFEFANEILTAVLEKYEIEEPSILEDMIISKVLGNPTSDEYSPRVEGSKGITSKREFDSILLDYRLRVDDKKVFSIPWEKYFVFVDVTDKAVIDGSYITAELISLAFDIPLESVKEDWGVNTNIDLEIEEEDRALKKFLEENSAIENFDKKLFSEKPLNVMHCEESYIYRDIYYSFSFDYSDERSVNFEFHGEI